MLRRPDAFRAKPADRSRCAASRQSFQELADEAFKDVLSSFGSASGRLKRVAAHLTKLRYDARASISFADSLLAISGIGGKAVAWYPSPHCSSRLLK